MIDLSARDLSAGFNEPHGQGWDQIGLLLIAVALSFLIGVEREARQKSAGIRTYTLVGMGAALFMLVSKFGFADVLGDHVSFDPSRVAAQIVSGLGFIGGGLIFVRRDSVHGLATAASMWLTAAIAAAAAAGLPALAAASTALYFVVGYVLRPLAHRAGVARWVRTDQVSVRVSYLDGHGLLRLIIAHCTLAGFAVSQLATLTPSLDGDGDGEEPAGRRGRLVDVVLTLTGKGDLNAMSEALTGQRGVVALTVPAVRPEDE